jgi:hypothetical protein
MEDMTPHTNESAPRPVLAYQAANSSACLGTTACRILAVWMFAQSVAGIGTVIAILADISTSRFTYSPSTFWIPSAVSPALWLVMGIICWRMAPRVGSRISGRADATPSMPNQGLVDLSLVAVGAYVIAEGVPEFVGNILDYAYRSLSPGQFWNNHGQLVASGTKCAIGIWLTFGSRGTARLIARARGSGG